MSPALIAVFLTAVAVAIGAVVLGRSVHRDASPSGPTRPWWGAPAPWVMASAALLLLGLYVFPRLLGFVFLFLPLIWMRRARRPSEWDHRPRDREDP